MDINDVNIDNTLLSSKYHFGRKNLKYYVGYVNHSNDSIKPLIIKLPKLSGSIKSLKK